MTFVPTEAKVKDARHVEAQMSVLKKPHDHS